MKKITFIKSTATILIILSALSSCAMRGETNISDKAGVGRETASSSDNIQNENPSDSESTSASETSSDGYTPPPLDKDRTDDTLPTEYTWKLEDGKYTYSTPARDDSGLSDMSGLSALYGIPFDDQPDDWYFGKTERNLTTGEVKYVWDRSASTLSKIEQYGGIYRGDEESKVCYLTFDCGYEYGTTSQILDTLKEKNAPATFFLTGQYVKEDDGLITRMLDEGHIVGNHTIGHTKMTEVTPEEFVNQLESLEDIYYQKYPDAPPMLYFRPPSGSSNEWLLAMSDKMGYRTVMWSWAYYDYDTANQLPVAQALEKAKVGLHNGAVYLLHAESQTNADMLGSLIDWIRAQGYEILPLCDID